MKIAISTESTIDVTKEVLEEYDIHVVPFSVLLGEKMGIDGEITPEEIFAYVDENKTLPKTSAVNEFQYEEHFNKLFEQGYDAIIHFSLSSLMSSAFSNAQRVAEKMKNVFVIDSKSLSTGIALLAIYARKLANENLDPAEIANKCNDRVGAVQASFVLNTVDYLYHGGRCSAMKKFGVNLLRLKPEIIVSDGKMESSRTYRGKNEVVIKNYCEDVLSDFNNPDLSVAFLTHSSASPEMIEAAKNALTERGFKKIYVTTAGATITSHCGPKCLGILYINDGQK